MCGAFLFFAMSDVLNIAQREAVECLRGPCLVLAGAGSGKTRVIAHKIARLLEIGLPATRIAAITFTNKAAAEMRARTRTLAGAQGAKVMMCTFHALGVRLLRADGQALGLGARFSILDASDALALIRECGATSSAALARRWQFSISRWKSAGLTAQQALDAANDTDERRAARVMARYQERLVAYQSVDFDDLIALPLRLLRAHDDVAQKWRDRLAYILVDEYQDTSATQYELLRLLVGNAGHFTAVGDDDQSIYGWRGATLDNLRRLPEDFPGLRVIRLETNYRSTEPILRAANHVIAANPKLYEKTLRSAIGAGEAVRVFACLDERHEAAQALRYFQQLHARWPQLRWGDCAILYRANHQAKAFEQVLRQAHIPYRVSGGTSFFERTEIKDICAWLRLWVNERDDPAFLRAITTPKRGIGTHTLAALGALAERLHLPLLNTLEHTALATALSQRAIDALHEFGRQVDALRAGAARAAGKVPAHVFLHAWLRDIGYEQHLAATAESAAQAQARWSNVLDFCEWMAARCENTAENGNENGGQATLLEVAQTVSLISTLGERQQEGEDALTLSTLHAAKGLEWPHVLLAGVTEGVLPLRPEDAGDTAARDARVQEERRLMYVGITRAQRTLAISWTRQRKVARALVPARASRFIAEMALHAQENTATAPGDAKKRLQALREQLAQAARAMQSK